jgi:hypothetical protein
VERNAELYIMFHCTSDPEDLKTALMAAQASEQRLTAEIEAERRQHGATREQSNAVSAELMTGKAARL